MCGPIEYVALPCRSTVVNIQSGYLSRIVNNKVGC